MLRPDLTGRIGFSPKAAAVRVSCCNSVRMASTLFDTCSVKSSEFPRLPQHSNRNDDLPTVGLYVSSSRTMRCRAAGLRPVSLGDLLQQRDSLAENGTRTLECLCSGLHWSEGMVRARPTGA